MKIQGTEYKCTKCNWDTPEAGQLIFCESLLKGFYCPECSEMLEPVKEVKEIRPEDEGELWKYSEGNHDEYLHTEYVDGELCVVKHEQTIKFHKAIKVIHNQNGWTRIHPKVEEDVERIVIEGVKWEKHGCPEEIEDCLETMAISNTDKPYSVLRDLGLSDKPPMKMILEIPKDNI